MVKSHMVISRHLGTVRFFFAFILLGVCLFWKSAMFSSPESAAEMLFSLMRLGWDWGLHRGQIWGQRY
jgi:hypothetical protein